MSNALLDSVNSVSSTLWLQLLNIYTWYIQGRKRRCAWPKNRNEMHQTCCALISRHKNALRTMQKVRKRTVQRCRGSGGLRPRAAQRPRRSQSPVTAGVR